MVNMNEAINTITKAGNSNVKIEQEGSSYKIVVLQGGVWTPIITGITKPIAEDIVKQATNRTLLG